jgi:uncharacterized protein
MAVQTLDPLRLDVATFAAQALHLEGTWSLAQLPRVAESHVEPGDIPAVTWRFEGEARPVRAGEPEIWLHVQGDCSVALACQRCLGSVVTPLEVDCWIRFVADEALAAELDAESEDDVLALQRWTNLAELLEDEFVLALPLVPRHDVCPEPLPMPEVVLEESDEVPAHPFAKLAQLKLK